MNYRKLRGRIVEKYGTINAFADAIGLSSVAVSYKLNAKRGFKQADIVKWCEALDITPDEIGGYFFG